MVADTDLAHDSVREIPRPERRATIFYLASLREGPASFQRTPIPEQKIDQPKSIQRTRFPYFEYYVPVYRATSRKEMILKTAIGRR